MPGVLAKTRLESGLTRASHFVFCVFFFILSRYNRYDTGWGLPFVMSYGMHVATATTTTVASSTTMADADADTATTAASATSAYPKPGLDASAASHPSQTSTTPYHAGSTGRPAGTTSSAGSNTSADSDSDGSGSDHSDGSGGGVAIVLISVVALLSTAFAVAMYCRNRNRQHAKVLLNLTLNRRASLMRANDVTPGDDTDRVNQQRQSIHSVSNPAFDCRTAGSVKMLASGAAHSTNGSNVYTSHEYAAIDEPVERCGSPAKRARSGNTIAKFEPVGSDDSKLAKTKQTVLPSTPGYARDNSIQVNQDNVEYVIPLTPDDTYVAEAGSAAYRQPLTIADADATYSLPLALGAGTVVYAAAPLTTADEGTPTAGYGAPLTTATDDVYSVPLDDLDASNADGSQA